MAAWEFTPHPGGDKEADHESGTHGSVGASRASPKTRDGTGARSARGRREESRSRVDDIW
jgi:hypothetical protein